MIFTVEENPDHFLDTAFTYVTLISSTAESSRNRENYQPPWIRNPHQMEKEFLLLVPSTELTAFLSILMATSKQWNNLSKCGIPQACYFSHSEQFSTRSTRRWQSYPEFPFQLKSIERFSSSSLNAKEIKNLSKTFVSKLNNFTDFEHIFIVLWKTRQIKSLFNLKDKNSHRSHVVCKGDCGANYMGKNTRNVEVRIDEHSNQ